MKLIILLVSFSVAAAKGQIIDIATFKSHASNFVEHTDNYIYLNRLQYSQILQEYDTTLEHFEQRYADRLEGISVQLDMVTASIVQNEKRLNPFEVLSDYFKRCVAKYRHAVPTVRTAKTNITTCVTEARSQISALLTIPLSTRSSLESYYKNNFEKEISNCGKKYTDKTANYTLCVSEVTADANDYTVSNQKSFQAQLEAAECTAKVNIKKALDCSYTVQTHTTTLISESNLLIRNCLELKDECKPCEEFTCSKSYNLQVDYENKTILNPFYGHRSNAGCLMLNVY